MGVRFRYERVRDLDFTMGCLVGVAIYDSWLGPITLVTRGGTEIAPSGPLGGRYPESLGHRNCVDTPCLFYHSISRLRSSRLCTRSALALHIHRCSHSRCRLYFPFSPCNF